jgi:hypothetical protein
MHESIISIFSHCPNIFQPHYEFDHEIIIYREKGRGEEHVENVGAW